MKKTFRISTICTISIVFALIIAAIITFVMVWSDKGFVAISDSSSEYMICREAAEKMERASAYLTEQSQLFVMNGDIKNLELYFEEVNVNKRRDKSHEELDKWYEGTDAMTFLHQAMDKSNELMDVEYHAMALAAQAYGLDMSSVDSVIANYPLSQEELSLSKEEKREAAIEMISNLEYQEARNEITSDVNSCMNDIITDVTNRESRARSIFEDAYLKLKIAVLVLLLLILGLSISLRFIIVKPLKKYDENVQANRMLPEEGALELRQLARTYNGVYIENKENQRLLRHEADHDALTRMLNRGSFDRILHLYENSDSKYALLIIDVDNFKEINDSNGHSMGDALLQKIAGVLKKGFRSMDYVFRIGGDEFAVIMADLLPENKSVVIANINLIREKLADTDGSIPAITISVGVAFSERENKGESIFSDADKALYQVKENGRDGFAFY